MTETSKTIDDTTPDEHRHPADMPSADAPVTTEPVPRPRGRGGKANNPPALPETVAVSRPNTVAPPGPIPPVQQQTASVGRAVHYVLPQNGKHRAATVSDVANAKKGQVSLHVLVTKRDFEKAMHPGFLVFIESVEYDADCAPGTWHWPERV